MVKGSAAAISVLYQFCIQGKSEIIPDSFCLKIRNNSCFRNLIKLNSFAWASPLGTTGGDLFSF